MKKPGARLVKNAPFSPLLGFKTPRVGFKRPFFAPFSEANVVLKANDFPRQALDTQTNIGKVESKKRSCRMDLVKRLMAGKVCENGLF
jgi:hypothetical protein